MKKTHKSALTIKPGSTGFKVIKHSMRPEV